MPNATDLPANVDVANVNASSVGLRASAEAANPLTSSSLSFLSQGKVLHSARGLEDPSRSVSTFSEVVRGSTLSPEQCSKLEAVWQKARIDGKDFGADIKQLIPVLQQSPGLIEKLHDVATATSLFGVSKGIEVGKDKRIVSERAFEVMRSEFLVELLREAVSPSSSVQGETMTCTSAKSFSNTSAENILGKACDLALYTATKTAGYDHVSLGDDRKDLLTRLVPYAEEESGITLSGNGQSTRSVETVSARLPSFGMAMVRAAFYEMYGGDVTSEHGQTYAQYTQMCRSVSGFERAALLRGGEVQVDQTGRPVLEQTASTRAVGQVEYLHLALQRIAKDSAVKDIVQQGSDKGHVRGVEVDAHWNDLGTPPGSQVRHGRHFLSATGLVEGQDGWPGQTGQKWYRLENPIGSYVQQDGAEGEQPRFHATGSVLGDPNGKSMWGVAGEEGIIYVRQDVLEKHLVAVQVQFDERYDARNGASPVRLLGPQKMQRKDYESPIPFLAPAPRQIDSSASPNNTSNLAKQATEQDRPTLAGVAMAQQAEARRNKANQAGEQSAAPTYLAVVKSAERQDTEILEQYDRVQDRTRKPPSNEKLYASFTSSVPSAAPVAASVAPPPPPLESPDDRAAKRRQGSMTTAA